MFSFNQGNTQVYSPFGTLVIEQRDRGFEYPRHSRVPEPSADAEAHAGACATAKTSPVICPVKEAA